MGEGEVEGRIGVEGPASLGFVEKGCSRAWIGYSGAVGDRRGRA